MQLDDQEELKRQLSSLKMAATGIEQYLDQPDDLYTEEAYDELLDGLIDVAASTLLLATRHQESLGQTVMRRAIQHAKVMEDGAAALEKEADKQRAQGNIVGADISMNSARLVRAEIQKLTVEARRASLKLVR